MLNSSSARAASVWIYGFVILQLLCQVALVAPLGSARIVFRILTFSSSIFLLAYLPFSKPSYPIRRLGMSVIIITALGMLHPQLNNAIVGIAAIAMCLAIWGPIYWVDRIQITPEVFSRILLLMWIFHTASAMAGVLQVYDPDRFAPDPEFVKKLLGAGADGLLIKLDDGRKIYRPFGLTDTPGGASVSGSFVAMVGINLFSSRSGVALRLLGAGSAIVGLFCLYICQVRSLLIVTCMGFVFMAGVNLARGHVIKSGMSMIAVVAALFAGFVWATALGGEAVTSRLETLTEADAGTVYYSNRGHFLESTLDNDIPNYPLGAGLGRWGMISGYFGDDSNVDSHPLWVEIQATGWVFDGGLPLLIVGYSAVITACVISIRIAIYTRSEIISESAGVIAVMNLGSLITTFNYPVFISQGGMMFWVLNAALFAASVTQQSATPIRQTAT